MNANPAANRKPATIIGLVIVAAAIAAIGVAAAVLVFDDDGTSPGSGGGNSPAELTAVFEALPVFPGAELDVPPTYTGGPEAFSTYWATSSPEAIVTFLVDELSAAGWSVVGEPSSFDTETTGKETAGWAASFENEDYSLEVSVIGSEKDPARGNAYIRLGVESK